MHTRHSPSTKQRLEEGRPFFTRGTHGTPDRCSFPPLPDPTIPHLQILSAVHRRPPRQGFRGRQDQELIIIVLYDLMVPPPSMHKHPESMLHVLHQTQTRHCRIPSQPCLVCHVRSRPRFPPTNLIHGCASSHHSASKYSLPP